MLSTARARVANTTRAPGPARCRSSCNGPSRHSALEICNIIRYKLNWQKPGKEGRRELVAERGDPRMGRLGQRLERGNHDPHEIGFLHRLHVVAAVVESGDAPAVLRLG